MILGVQLFFRDNRNSITYLFVTSNVIYGKFQYSRHASGTNKLTRFLIYRIDVEIQLYIKNTRNSGSLIMRENLWASFRTFYLLITLRVLFLRVPLPTWKKAVALSKRVSQRKVKGTLFARLYGARRVKWFMCRTTHARRIFIILIALWKTFTWLTPSFTQMNVLLIFVHSYS